MAAAAAPAAGDLRHMRRALELAERGWGRVQPNPLVGAVVVRDGAIVGEGFHEEFGGPHAEVIALRAAGERSRGADLYVSLEPCRHHGKTPPCTDAIVAAGVRRVVYAAADPTARAGGGGGVLRAAGLDVVVGVERAAAERQNALFFHAARSDTPFVALKLALSLDGRIAAGEGRTTPITGPAALAEVHRLRAGFDAILVGGRTARTDDPLLTARGQVRPRRPPLRVVLDPALRLAPRSRLVQSVAEAPLLVFCAAGRNPAGPRELEAAAVRIAEVPAAGDGLDLHAVLLRLADEGVGSVLCEGGGRLGRALLDAGLVHRLYLIYAPIILGEGAVPGFPGGGSPALPGRSTPEVRRFGPDTLLTLDLAPEDALG
jgi:diaminohydroxyphosphoribosylaminopyrimidine deaminase / 5-amino-6-(5-phosphoribosylamino)uracil reductase